MIIRNTLGFHHLSIVSIKLRVPVSWSYMFENRKDGGEMKRTEEIQGDIRGPCGSDGGLGAPSRTHQQTQKTLRQFRAS